jgi:hypothetical protein
VIGVTKERVRQIQNKAMEKIKLQLEAYFLGNKDALEAQRQQQQAEQIIAPLLESLSLN